MTSSASLNELPSELLDLAKIEAEEDRRTIAGYIHSLTPRYERPIHLGPLSQRLEQIPNGKPLRLVVHTPPRHGKTESLLHFIPWLLERRPEWTVGYSSYSADITQSKARVALQLCKDAGIPLVVDNITESRTPQRGGFLARGVGEGLTGQGLNIALVDDPVKDRVAAESKLKRESTKAWFRDVLMTRVEPGGSVIVNMARWHPDDLAGFCIKELGWEYLCLPAIDDESNALWPSRWPVDALQARRQEVGEYTWESLYQGRPRPRGTSVFQDAYLYETLPSRFRVGIGLDLSYSAKTSSDYSVAVVMAECDKTFYLLEILRRQVRAPDFLDAIRPLKLKYPSARWRWYAAGTEQGTGDFFNKEARDDKLRIQMLAPKGDKFTRSIPYSAAWNDKRVLLPENAAGSPWLSDFLEEHAAFTGINDEHDDIVDAAVAAFDLLATPNPVGGLGIVRSRR